MNKLINDPGDVVADALRGVEAAHSDRVRVDHENKIVYRKDAPRQGKVGLISGGGSGHEPMHSGFVGLGMLDAACCGEVFTSPVPDQMMAATTAVDGGAGVLHIVKNYTGDVMNFEMAAEMAEELGEEALADPARVLAQLRQAHIGWLLAGLAAGLVGPTALHQAEAVRRVVDAAGTGR